MLVLRNASSWYVHEGALVLTGGTRKIEMVEEGGFLIMAINTASIFPRGTQALVCVRVAFRGSGERLVKQEEY